MNARPLIVRFALYAVIAASLALSLVACVPVAIVGGATAGAMIASDRRTGDQQGQDSEIERIIERRLKENFGDRVNISANVYDRTLLLTGEVPTTELKAEVDALVKLTPKLRRTVDEIRIEKLSESRWRGNDGLITANVKTRFGQSGLFDVSVIRVVTEAGSVYLMGKVTQKEADAAINIARNAQGVSRVVNVMDVVGEDEIARLKNGNRTTPAPTATTPAAR